LFQSAAFLNHTISILLGHKRPSVLDQKRTVYPAGVPETDDPFVGNGDQDTCTINMTSPSLDMAARCLGAINEVIKQTNF
jgi:hypothetical protein